MNIKNLKPGQIFPNYKELCKTLEVPVKGGKGKTLQLDELRRFVTFEQHKGKKSYVIYEIKEFPLPKLRRKGNTIDSLYFSLISFLISKTDENNLVTRVNLSASKLHLILGFCNEKYYGYYKDFDEGLELIAQDNLSFRDLLKEMKVELMFGEAPSVPMAETARDFRVFYEDGQTIMYKTLGRILQALHESEIILVNEKFQVKRDRKGAFYWATEDETVILKTFRGIIISKLDCKHFGEVISTGKRWIFERELSLMLEKEGIFETRKYYEFAFTRELVKVFQSYKQVYSGVDFTRLEANAGIVKYLERDEAEFRRICIDNFILLEDNGSMN